MAKVGLLRLDRKELLQRSRFARLSSFTYELVRSCRGLGVGLWEFGPIINNYGEWAQSIKTGLTPIELGVPWIVYSSRDFLRDFLRPDDIVFEYGAGGSTIFFAGLGLHGISIEHDASWAKVVESELARSCPNAIWEVKVIPPNSTKADAQRKFRSNNPAYRDHSFVDYVRAIESFPKGHFSVVAIDGRARNACIEIAADYVAPGGILLVDNSDRQAYWPEINKLKAHGWQSRNFNGPLPAVAAFSRTTILRRPLK
ncbi:hypothetical protein [Mycolicibacterium sp.]|uniref:hypothetical protein n=1 Tax=Mycolicibacterium sp. TaxID=2320850 RepID=UPI0037C680AD